MPELKRSFSKGQMNKDLDERLIQDGTYRDALNIEVSTSEGSNVGAIETLKGNTALTTAVESGSTCIGSIADEQNDKIYWLVAGSSSGVSSGTGDTAVTVFRDYILEHDVSSATTKYVFVDVYKSTAVTTASVSNATTIPVGDATYIRRGMQVSGVAGVNLVTVTAVSGLNITVSESVTIPDASAVTFETPTTNENDPGKPGGRTLNYDEFRIITGLNVVDGMLIWTDNHSEPKKINIERSLLGTGLNDLTLADGGSSTYHTRLVITDEKDDNIIVTDTGSYPVYMEEQYITVIKRAPLLAPFLSMSDTLEARGETLGVTTTQTRFYVSNVILESGDSATISLGSILGTGLPDYREGDIILLSNAGSSSFTEHEVRARIDVGGTPSQNGTQNDYNITILSISQDVPDADETWNSVLELTPPLFEKKFVRFASRFKYEDGEYSAFSPFSEVAFLPGNFEYYASEGYNLGMSNNLRSLKIQDFVPEKSILPQDVVAVDILYKEDGSPNVYTVRTVERNSTEWTAAGSGNGLNNGELLIESDVIHAVLPSNQLLRPFDEVPRKALAQDITGGRIVYGNYLHKYKMDGFAIKDKNINVNLNAALDFTNITTVGTPEKSLKSLRNYQIGIVYRDIYGRETPVFTSENTSTQSSVLQIDKPQCVTSNKIHVDINSVAPKFADSFKFFVKETSNEYYNLAMDRWYNAEDGNIWLSFPSSERNKVDEETFLILKKEHDGSAAVTENYKYKILSIVGEAPTFVKTISRFVATLTNTSVGNVSDGLFGQIIGNTILEGYPLPNLDSFMIDTATYQNSALADAFEAKQTFVRFRTATAASNYYKILNVTTGDASSGTATKLTVEGRFGSDLDFTSTSGSVSTRISGLIADFKTESVEDKPEFEGRFFAKIYKDLGVRQYITKETSEEVDNLIVSKALPVRWVKTDGVDMNNALSDDTSAINSPTHQFSSPLSFTEWGAVDIKGGASAAWHNVSSGDFDNDGDLGGFGLDPDQIGSNAYGSQGAEYWRDFARVYGGATSGSGDNNHFFIDEAFYRQELDTDGTGISGTKAGRGEGIRPNTNPSVNITIDQDLIDISWANIHPKGDTAAFSSAEYPIAYDFIYDLYRAGTRFRFRDDPDQIVYTVESLEGHTQRIQNYRVFSSSNQNDAENKRETWTMSVSPRFGNGPSGYHPLKPETHFEVSSGNGLGQIAVDRFHNNVGSTAGTATGTARAGSRMQPHGNSPGHIIELLQTVTSTNSPDDSFTDNPGLWETEPKEDIGLDIYYEVGRTYPVSFDFRTNEQLIPVGSTVSLVSGTATSLTTQTVTACNDNTVTLSSAITNSSGGGDRLKFTFPKEYDTDLPGSIIMSVDQNSATAGSSNTVVTLSSNVHDNAEFILPYFNCYNFGNGNESNRIRDDFNAPTIDKGVKVSTVTTEPYTEERRASSLIFSGIYNSRNGINNLNQFVGSDGITKDLNPKYGSIQKLHSRDGDVVTFMEDKIFKVQANKDSLFNVDGGTNLISTSKVLGFPTPVKGEYGISKNPESFAFQGYQAYFTDKSRGAVLRMSMDGLTVISNVGMKDYFSDTFKTANTNIIGTYDDKKSQYNLTFSNNTTVSWNEGTKAWVSFKSFLPESGVSFNNTYYTFFDGELYEHHINETRNNFYGTQYTSDFTLIMNDMPGSVKNFKTLNYEGTQAKVTQFQTSVVDSVADDLDGTYNDGEYYNLNAKTGWFVESITTDMQEGLISEFKEKEKKWFNYIRGAATTLSNLDTSEFSVQGLGKASAISRSDSEQTVFKLTVKENND